jgi:adenylate cyclase
VVGLSTDPGQASRQAIEAALRIRRGVADLNGAYRSELDQPLRIVMSLLAGSTIMGEMGQGRATNLTAVGDTLNAASRLEELAKELNAELVISDELATRVAHRLVGYRRQALTMGGSRSPSTPGSFPVQGPSIRSTISDCLDE